MQKTKFISYLAAGLLISNLILVAFIVFGRSNGDHHGPPRGPRNIIIERLHFDDNQIKAYDKLIAAHRSHVEETDKQIKDLKQQLYSTLENPDHVSDRDSLIHKIGEVQMAMERVHLKHFEEIGALCTESQKPLFTALTTEIASLFGRPPHNSRPR